MDIRKGVKKTDVGVIPVEWELKSLKKVSKLVTKGTTPRKFTATGITYVKIENLKGDTIDIDNCLFIDDDTHTTELKRSILKAGDLLFAIAGSIGKCAIVPSDILPANTNQALAIIRLNESENQKYIFYFLTSSLMQKYIANNITVGAQPNLSLSQIGEYLFPFPQNKSEQTAIATALSDMDELISQTEKLIEKKKAIKQGVMQELLRPKEGWVTKKFTDVVEYIHGKAHEQYIVDDGKYKVVNSKFISTDGEIVKYSNSSFLTAKKNDILTVLSDLPNGKALAKCFLVDQDNLYAVNQRVCIWRSKGANPLFLFYLLNRHKYFLHLDDGVTQTHILNGDINRFEITITEDTEVQKQIGIVIRDIDKEIGFLEKKCLKLKLQKQGMLQSLLTGRIRLI